MPQSTGIPQDGHPIFSVVPSVHKAENQKPEHTRIGTALVTVHDDEFANGYQTGYLFYMAVSRRRSLSESQIHAYILHTITDVHHSQPWNAGQIAGWFGAMHEKTSDYTIAQVHEEVVDGICEQIVEGM